MGGQTRHKVNNKDHNYGLKCDRNRLKENLKDYMYLYANRYNWTYYILLFKPVLGRNIQGGFFFLRNQL